MKILLLFILLTPPAFGGIYTHDNPCDPKYNNNITHMSSSDSKEHIALTADVVIYADTLCIQTDIITNGFELILNAKHLVFLPLKESGRNPTINVFTKENSVAPPVTFVDRSYAGRTYTGRVLVSSYDEADTLPPQAPVGRKGENGRVNLKDVIINTFKVTGQATLNPNGQKGGKGGKGATGYKAMNGIKGRDASGYASQSGWPALTCRHRRNHPASIGSNSGFNGLGGNGGEGGKGGDPLRFIVNIWEDYSQSQVFTVVPFNRDNGGEGGDPGDNGETGTAGRGGDGYTHQHKRCYVSEYGAGPGQVNRYGHTAGEGAKGKGIQDFIDRTGYKSLEVNYASEGITLKEDFMVLEKIEGVLRYNRTLMDAAALKIQALSEIKNENIGDDLKSEYKKTLALVSKYFNEVMRDYNRGFFGLLDKSYIDEDNDIENLRIKLDYLETQTKLQLTEYKKTCEKVIPRIKSSFSKDFISFATPSFCELDVINAPVSSIEFPNVLHLIIKRYN